MIITLFPAWVHSHSGIRTYSYLKLQGMWSSRINKSCISDYFKCMQVCLLIDEMTIPPLKVKWSSPSQGGQDTRRLSGYASAILSFFDVHASQIFHWALPQAAQLWGRGSEGHSYKSLETFRLEDENDYEYEIWLKFFAYCQKIDTPEFFIVLSFARKVSTVIVIDGR